MLRAVLPVLLLLPAMAYAGSSPCDVAAVKAFKEQSWVRPPQGLVVTAPKRLHFHRAPDAACATKVYVVHDDALTAYNEWNGWFSVQYTHPKSGKISSGWVHSEGVRTTGALGMESGQPKLPPEATALAERSAMCTHFAGEFNGDGSEHDREVNKTMTELRCGSVEQDVAAARRKYANHPAVLQALDQAEAP